MRKQLVITSLSDEGTVPARIAAQIKPYGLDAVGNIWQDDLKQMAWQGLQELLLQPETSAWMLLASPKALQLPSIRYGLSLLLLTVTSKRPFLPCLVVSSGQTAPQPDTLPVLLSKATCLTATDPSLCAKLVAKINLPPKKTDNSYRLNVLGSPQLGQWFEAGPGSGESWSGALLGVCGAEIDFHAVGPSGELPENTVLNYPSTGMKLSMHGKEFLAWGVANQINTGESYFVRVKGNPEAILFGPFPAEDDEAELYYQKLSL